MPIDRFTGGGQGGSAGGPASSPDRGRSNRGRKMVGPHPRYKRRTGRKMRRMARNIRSTSRKEFRQNPNQFNNNIRQLARRLQQQSHKTGPKYHDDAEALFRAASRRARQLRHRTKNTKATRSMLDLALMLDRDVKGIGKNRSVGRTQNEYERRLRKTADKNNTNVLEGLGNLLNDTADANSRRGGNGGGGGRNRPRRRGGRRRGGRGDNNVGFSPTVIEQPNLRQLHRQARGIVQADTNAELRNILQQLRQSSRSYRREQKKTIARGKNTRDDLRYIFGETADWLGAQQGQMNDRYTGARQNVNDIYDNMQSNVQANTNQNQNAMLDELRRMGINSVDTSQFNKDATFLQNMGEGNRGNAMANLQSGQTGANSVADMLAAAMQGERTSAIGKSYNEQGEQLGDLRQDYTDIFKDLRGQAARARQGQGAAVRELLLTLEDQQYQRQAEMGQQNFLNQMAANEFNLDVDKFNFDIAQNRQELIQQRAAARRRRRNQKLERIGRGIQNDLMGALQSFWG